MIFRKYISLFSVIVFLGCDSSQSHNQVESVDLQLSFKTGVDFKGLDEILFRYLRASKRWDSCIDYGREISMYTNEKDYVPSDALHVIREEGVSKKFRAVISVGESFNRLHDLYGNVSHVSLEKADIDVVSRQGTYESYIIFNIKNIYIEVFESSRDLKRSLTKRILLEIYDELSAVLSFRDSILENRVSPSGSPFFDGVYFGHNLKVVKGIQRGIYNITSEVNPSKPGVIKLKATEVNSGKPVPLRWASPILLGVDEEAVNRKILFEKTFRVAGGDLNFKRLVLFELLLEADDGEEKKLASVRKYVSGWER